MYKNIFGIRIVVQKKLNININSIKEISRYVTLAKNLKQTTSIDS